MAGAALASLARGRNQDTDGHMAGGHEMDHGAHDMAVMGECTSGTLYPEAYLRDFGGHIGYGVRPSERRKGYATLMLRLVLDKARAMGIERVLITCDKDNLASARVIQKNGGVLDSESYSEQAKRVTQRYWIEL